MSRFRLQPLDAIMPYLLADIAMAGGSFRELERKTTEAVRDLVASKATSTDPSRQPQEKS